MQSHTLQSLAGANVEGRLELRNATTAASMTMAANKTFVVSLREGMLHVAVQ